MPPYTGDMPYPDPTPTIDLLVGLDFDGVLSPGNTGTLRYAENLADLLEEFPESRVLLTTNWRDTHSSDELLEWLPPKLARRVVGQTPSTFPGDAPGARQKEIELWTSGRSIRRLIALDDVASLYRPGWRYLHLVDGRNALDRDEMARLRPSLQAALPWGRF